MATSTQAEVVFSGSGNLKELLEKVNGGIKDFGKTSVVTTKHLTKLNKESKITDGLFKSMSDNVKGLREGFRGLTTKGKDSVNLVKDLSDKTVGLKFGLEDANKGLSGLGLRLVGLRDESVKAGAALRGPVEQILDIARASDATERAFIILSKISKPLRATLKFISFVAKEVALAFKELEHIVVNLVRNGINLATKALNFFTTTLTNLSKTIAQFGLFGKLISNQLSTISENTAKAAESAEKFNKSLDPSDLEKTNKAGNRLAKTFLFVGEATDTLAKGIFLADTVGKVVRSFNAWVDTGKQTVEVLGDVKDVSVEVGGKGVEVFSSFNTKLNTLSLTAGAFGKAFGSKLANSISLITGKMNAFAVSAASFTALAVGAADATLKAKGLNDAFSVIQSLGIDTSAAEIAFQFGLVGEKLLLSTEAAKEFARVSIQSFARTEDAAGFVTTLSAGANLQFQELGKGLESVTGFTSQLSNELNNAATSVDVSAALYNSLSAGIGVTKDNTVDLTQSANFLNAALKLSAGTGANAAGTVDLLSKVTTVYGLSANEAAITAGKLNQVVESGQVTFSELTSNLGRTASVAKATGVTLDETLASVSALTKIQGAEAQQGLASLLSAITGQGEQSKKTVQELGVQFDLNTVKTKGLNAALRDLNEAAGGNAETLKRVIPDILAFQTAQALIGPVAEDVQRNLAGMNSELINSGEALDNVFAAGQASTIKQFSALMNGFNEVLVEFGQRTLPAIQPGIDFLETFLEQLRNMPGPLKDLIGFMVIGKVIIGNFVGGLVSFGITVAGLIGSLIALNLLNKTVTGQLGLEAKVVRQLAEEQKDWGGALKRLIGYNKDVFVSGTQLNISLEKTRTALKGLSEVGINPNAAGIDGLREGITSLNKEIDRLKSSDLQIVDPVKFDKDLQRLYAIRKEANSAIKSVALAQRLAIDELPKQINNSIKDGTKPVKDRVEDFQKVIRSMFSVDRVGTKDSVKFLSTIDNLFEKSLSNTEETTAQKLLDISNTFEILRLESTPEIAKFLTGVERQLLDGTSRLGNSLAPLEKSITKSLKNLQSTAPEEVQNAFIKAVEKTNGGITSVEATLKQKKSSIRQVFKETVSSFPEEISSQRDPIDKAINSLLNDSTRNLKDRVSVFNQAFSQILKDAPDDLKAQASAIRLSAVEVAEALEVKIDDGSALNKVLNRANVSVQRGAGELRNEASNIAAITGQIKGNLFELTKAAANKGDFKEVFAQNAQDIKEALSTLPDIIRNEFVATSAAITIGFSTLMNDRDLSAEVKQSIGKVKDTFQKAIKDFSSGQISFDKLEESFDNARFSMNLALEGVASPEVIAGINKKLDLINLKGLEGTVNDGVIAIQALLDSIIDPELKAKIETRLKGVSMEALEVESKEAVVEVNKNLAQIANPETSQRISNNLAKTQKEILLMNERSTQAGKAGSKAFSGLQNSLDGVGGLLTGINPQLGAIFSTSSAFLTNFKDVSEGGKEIFSGLGEAVEQNAEKLDNFNIKNRNFVVNSTAASKVTDVMTKKKSGLATVTGIAGLAQDKFTGSLIASKGAAIASIPAIQGMAGSIGVATGAVWSFVAAAATALAPFVAIGVVLVATVKVIGELVPAVGKLVSADQKFAAQTEKSNETLKDTLEIFREYQKDSSKFKDSVDGSTKSLSTLKAEMETKKLDPKTLIPEKEFVSGWQRAIIWPAELAAATLIGTFANIGKWSLGLGKNIARVGQFFTQNIPFVGAFFKKIGDGFQSAINDVDLGSNALFGKVRGVFNKLRKTTQDFRASRTREAVAAQQAEVNALLNETDKLTKIDDKLGVASEKSKGIIRVAQEANRALTSSEFTEVMKEENDLAELGLEALNEQIKSKEALIEKTKDPQARAELQRQLELLSSQASEAERINALRKEFLTNQQAIGNALDLSNSSKDTEKTADRIQSIFTDLGKSVNGEEAQRLFAEMNGLEITTSKTGEKILNIAEGTLSNASLASRKASLALKSAQASFVNNVANLTNDELNISQDDLASSMMQVIEGVSRQIQEDPAFADEGARIIESLLSTQVETINGVGEAFSTLTAQQQAEVLEGQSEIFKLQLTQDTKLNEENIKRIGVLREKGTITQLESIKAVAEEQEAIDAAQLANLERQVTSKEREGVDSEAYKDAVRERDDFLDQISLNRAKENRSILEEELSLLQAKQDNELAGIKNIADEELNLFKIREKAIQKETEALNSKKDLNSAVNNFEETLLQNKLKLSSDVEEKAAIEVDLAERRVDLLETEIAFEKQNLEFQKTLNQLSSEREIIELRIQKAEIESQKLINQQKIDNAEVNNLTEEEVAALDLKNEALKLQSDLLVDTQSQLQDFAIVQAEMDDRALESLELRQQAQRASAEVDLELARRNQIIAGLDKQVEKIRLQARLVEVTNEERKVGLDNATKTMERQTQILEEQKGFLDSMSSIIEQNFQMAITAERNEFRKRRLEEEAAKAKLEALKTQQQIELAIFRINEQQKDLALEVRQIELAAAKEKAQADIAVAQAEAAKVAADPGATEEQKQAAELTIRAAETQLRSVEAQRELAGQERALNSRNAGLRDLQFRQEQSSALSQQEFSVAQSTRRRSDDRQLAREALDRARGFEEEFARVAQGFLSQIQDPSLLGPSIAPNLNTRSLPQQTLPNAPSENKKLEGIVDLNLSINVEGDAGRIDKEQLNRTVSETLGDGLYQLFDGIAIRQRG